MATKVPKRAQGRGRPNPNAHARPCMKHVSVPGTQGEENDLSYLEHRIIRMAPPVNRTPAQFNGHRTFNYCKGKHKFENLRFDNYHKYDKEQQGDFRFWMWFHADWFETVIMTKAHPTIEMESMDWTHLIELDLLVVAQPSVLVTTCTCRRS